MALPKLDVPTYEIELPISKKKVKYRPFLVKEQKNLLMALESNEATTPKTKPSTSKTKPANRFERVRSYMFRKRR